MLCIMNTSDGIMSSTVADGLAVGAAGLSNNACITFLVGAAMVLHKGPVAFGYTTYLVTIGEAKRTIHKGNDCLEYAAACCPP